MNIIGLMKKKILGYRYSSESYINYLRDIGVSIGEDVVLFRPFNTTIDIQNPHLLSIGSHVMITGPVTILTHDYSWSVIKRKYGYIAGNQKPVSIGDNVFIGWGSTILAGTHIGNNTVIGANSVVSGKLAGDSVYAGNPAKYVMSIEEYYEKRRKMQFLEAKEYVKRYQSQYNKLPPIEKMDEYFYLFTDAEHVEYLDIFDKKLRLLDTYQESKEFLLQHKAMFNSYEEFLASVIEDQD